MENKLFFENVEKLVENKNAVGLIHRVYLCYLKNKRKYTASTKTKAEIRGGGRKPWRQKGTGRARAGSSRSPLWVGGGVSFGPKPRLVEKKINKKERRLATLASLYLKKKEIVFIPESTFENFESSKTKNILNLIKELKIQETDKILFILSKANKFLWLASRNLKNIEITTSNCLNIEQILKTKYIILSNLSLEVINNTYGNK
jgi:large subunit ribosomal protein L4